MLNDFVTHATKSTLLATISGLALMVAAPAFAQQSMPAATSEPERGIETVVVTAQRREENLQSVPLSVSSFSAAQIQSRGLTDMSRLENSVPGLTFGRSGVDARPAIRGVRTENVGVNGDTTIGFFIDGVYQSRAAQATLGFVDLERIEVLRGPQGTLYGRNTFGGNISIATAQPRLGQFNGGLDVTIGENSKFRIEPFVNIPLSETAALRLSGASEDDDGYVKNVNPRGNNLFDEKTRYLRAALLLKPNDKLTATIKIDRGTRGGAGGSAFGYKLAGSFFDIPSNQQLFNATAIRNLNTRGGNRDGVVDAPLTIDAGIPLFAPGDPYKIDTDQKTILDLTSTGASANIAYDFDAFTVKSITGFADFEAIRTSDTDFSASTIGADYQLTSAKTFSQEFQLLSRGEGPLNYVVGAYYFDDELRGVFINEQVARTIRGTGAPVSLPVAGVGFYDEQRADTKSIAAYAQGSYAVTQRLKLTAGLRFTRDTKDFKFANAASVLPLSGTPPTPVGTAITLATGGIPASAFGSKGAPTNCVFPASAIQPRPGFACLATNTAVLTGATYDTAEFEKVTWRLAADYQLTDNNLFYGSISTGFRSGGFNSGQNQAALTPTFKPEKVIAYEIGSKNRFLDNTLQLNLAAFFNKYDSLQEQRQVPAGNTTLSIIENSGKAEAKGAEFEAIWRPVDKLTLNFSLSVLDAKYTDYTNVPLPFGTSITVADATRLTPTVVNGITIANAGQRRIFAPGYDCGPVPGTGTGAAGAPALAFGCNLTGKKLPYASDYSGSFSAQYVFDLGGLGQVTPLAVVTFNSGFYGQPANSVLDEQGAYTKLDLRVTWDINDKVSVAAFVNNVTDEATANRFVWGGGGALQASYAPPQLWGIKTNLRF
jgi:iron complex outermembrane receptor protein